MQKKYYTSRELEEYFKVSRYAIIRAVNSGKLKVSKKEGGKNLFSEEDVQAYISTNMTKK